MIVIRAILTALGALGAFFGVKLVVGGGIAAIIGGVALLALALGLLVLGLWTLRGSADDVTARLTQRQRLLESRAGRTPNASGPAAEPTIQQAPTNRAGRRAAERAARRRP